MKTTFASEEPKKFVYRDYKTFSHESFKNDLMPKKLLTKMLTTQNSRKS